MYSPEKKMEILKDLDLVRIMDETLTKPHFEGASKNTYNPSTASVLVKGKFTNYVIGSCHRELFYLMKGIPYSNPFTPEYKLAAELGKMVENYAVQCFREANILDAPSLFGRQPAVWVGEHLLSGFVDAVVEHKESSSLIVVEIKSFAGHYKHRQIMGHSNGKRGSKAIWTPGQPVGEHLIQLGIYLHAFRERLEGAKLFYFARDTTDRKQFDLYLEYEDLEDDFYLFDVNNKQRIDWFSIKSIYSRFSQLRSYIDNNVLPPRDFSREYTIEQLENLYQETISAPNGSPALYLLAKSTYEEGKDLYEKEGLTGKGDWRCNKCTYRNLCWSKENG